MFFYNDCYSFWLSYYNNFKRIFTQLVFQHSVHVWVKLHAALPFFLSSFSRCKIYLSLPWDNCLVARNSAAKDETSHSSAVSMIIQTVQTPITCQLSFTQANTFLLMIPLFKITTNYMNPLGLPWEWIFWDSCLVWRSGCSAWSFLFHLMNHQNIWSCCCV